MSEWIKCDKTMPKSNGRYLIFVDGGEQLTADYDVKFGFESAEDGCAYLQHMITHWMPLPPPPKD